MFPKEHSSQQRHCTESLCCHRDGPQISPREISGGYFGDKNWAPLYSGWDGFHPHNMNLATFWAPHPQHRMKKPSPFSGRAMWPDFSRKYSRVARPSVTLTARIPICSQGLMFSSFPPPWLGSHSLRKHLFCQHNQDPERLIFPGQ